MSPNVSKLELSQAVGCATGGANRKDRQEDDPGHQPDRDKDADHQPQEADEEVCVKTVDGLDIGEVGT